MKSTARLLRLQKTGSKFIGAQQCQGESSGREEEDGEGKGKKEGLGGGGGGRGGGGGGGRGWPFDGAFREVQDIHIGARGVERGGGGGRARVAFWRSCKK